MKRGYLEIIARLRDQGYRITPTREGILKMLSKKGKPVAASEMRDCLLAAGVAVNKTTVYRELEVLLREKCIEEVRLNDGRRYYEIVSEHHHHVVCLHCNGIDDIVLEKEFFREEKRIELDTGFKVLNHSLEFFGVCAKCQ